MKMPVSREEFVLVNSQVVQVLTANQEHLTMTRRDLQQLAYSLREDADEAQGSKKSSSGDMYQ